MQTVQKIGILAESKNSQGILEYILPEYKDFEGRTYDDIKELLLKKFAKYTGIVINILKTKIKGISVPKAQIETDVALSSGTVKVFRKIARFAGSFYRFKVELQKADGTWMVKEASWHYLTFDELFPESMELLKKIFPHIFK